MNPSPVSLQSALMCEFITCRNEVVAKVIFLHLFVILFTGGGEGVVSHKALRQNPPWTRHTTPPEQTPPDQTPPRADPPRADPPRADPPRADPPRPDTPSGPDPPGSRLRHTVYERLVRILLECILVLMIQKQPASVNKKFRVHFPDKK